MARGARGLWLLASDSAVSEAALQRGSVAATRARTASSAAAASVDQARPARPPILGASERIAPRTAIVDLSGEQASYQSLAERSLDVSGALQAPQIGTAPGDRVAILCSGGSAYAASLLGVWDSLAMAVPLCTAHPINELEYTVKDSGSHVVLTDSKYEAVATELAAALGKDHPVRVVNVDKIPANSGQARHHLQLAHSPEDPLLIIYTSGTTGPPKGVVWRRKALEANTRDMAATWGWRPTDRILHFLPLHHVHGVVNKLLTPLTLGACVEFSPFKPRTVWDRLARNADGAPEEAITVFMGVPTVYAKLIESWNNELSPSERAASRAGIDASMRLMVSGSAALPLSVFEAWERITGHRLLERYGMSEFGMGLTNPLEPMSSRVPGYVGKPFPSAEVRIVDESTNQVLPPGESGALQIRGPIVFDEYWKRPEATQKEFAEDGWFRTGDVAVFDPTEDSYKILGRSSVDIIKFSGYKVSALDVERHLLEHPDVSEIAVLGLSDDTYGQIIAAVVVRPDGAVPAGDDAAADAERKAKAALQAFMFEAMPKYKAPQVVKFVPSIPRNAMGKINKKQLVKQVFGDSAASVAGPGVWDYRV